MSRPFPLAGLLRLRAMAEDQAVGELAAARRDQRSAAERAGRTAERLGSWQPPAAADLAAWQAAVAARVALSSLLVEHTDDVDRADHVVADKQQRWTAARTRTRAVERLEEKHVEQVATEEGRAEQAALDEVAGRLGDPTAPPGEGADA